MITNPAAKLITRLLADPEWPKYFGFDRDNAPVLCAAWREAAALSLITGQLHNVKWGTETGYFAAPSACQKATIWDVRYHYPPPVE